MKIIKEFKQFALRGNVIDLAVGVIIGAAFGKIISSLVADIITPVLSLITGGIKFSERTLILRGGANPVLLNYGAFLQNVIDFILIAWVIFLMVKAINRLYRKTEPEKIKEPSAEEKLLTEIRDLLANKAQ
jgi:large conductance mechanosensitive channel